MLMDPQTRASCAALLERDELDVEHLHECAELLPALLARIGLLMVASQAIAEHAALSNSAHGRYLPAQPAHQPAGPRWVDSVRIGWGVQPFTAARLMQWAEQGATGPQRAVLVASRALCGIGIDCDLTPHRLGIAIAEHFKAEPLCGLVEQPPVRNTLQWSVRDLRD